MLNVKWVLIWKKHNWPSSSIPCGWVYRCVSYHYLRCLKSPRTKLEETVPESPRPLLTSTVGGWERGVGHDGITTGVNLWRRWVSLPSAAQIERTSQLLMSRCKSVIWGLLDRPRNRALKENTRGGGGGILVQKADNEGEKWTELQVDKKKQGRKKGQLMDNGKVEKRKISPT